MSFLLDTSVTSEFVKPSPDDNVVEWMKRADETSLYPRGINGVLRAYSELKLSLHADPLPRHHLSNAARSIEAVLPEFRQHLGLGIG